MAVAVEVVCEAFVDVLVKAEEADGGRKKDGGRARER